MLFDEIVRFVRRNKKKALTAFLIHFPVIAIYGSFVFSITNERLYNMYKTGGVGYAIFSYAIGDCYLILAIIAVWIFYIFGFVIFKIIHTIVTGIIFAERYGNVTKLINKILCKINNKAVHIEKNGYIYEIYGIPGSVIPKMNEYLYAIFKFGLLSRLACMEHDFHIDENARGAISIMPTNDKTNRRELSWEELPRMMHQSILSALKKR